jgi:putative membrane protein
VLTAISDHPLDLTNDSVRLAAERTSLAVERTRLAHERTLMAWVRTATSLISFGFTIYKTFQYLQDQQGSDPIHRAFSPRVFAMTMICLGVGALSLATLQHWKELRALYGSSGQPVPRSTSLIVAFVVASLGILALVLVVLRQ